MNAKITFNLTLERDMKPFKNTIFKLLLLTFAFAVSAQEPNEPEQLHIMSQDDNKVFMAGDIKITRTMTKCAKNKGWLQGDRPYLSAQ